MPDTVAVPTVVPPLVQVEGALDCGPNTLNVIVPEALLVAALSAALRELAAMAVPAVPVDGAEDVVVVAFLTTVEAMPDPHVLAEEVLLVSPP